VANWPRQPTATAHGKGVRASGIDGGIRDAKQNNVTS
jgi:hypothetical protein